MNHHTKKQTALARAEAEVKRAREGWGTAGHPTKTGNIRNGTVAGARWDEYISAVRAMNETLERIAISR